MEDKENTDHTIFPVCSMCLRIQLEIDSVRMHLNT